MAWRASSTQIPICVPASLLLRPRTAKHSFPAQSLRYELLNFVTRAKRAGLGDLAFARALCVRVLLPRAFAAMLAAP